MGGSIAKIPPPLFIYGDGFFRGPLGFEVGFRSTPFRKWVLSYRSKKTNNPNPSPIGKRFGLYGFGADDGTRTRTAVGHQHLKLASLPVPAHPHIGPTQYIIVLESPFVKCDLSAVPRFFPATRQ